MSLLREVNTLHPSMVEIRYDLMRTDPEAVAELLSESIIQVATCRPGHYSDFQRMDILKRAIETGAVYVDVEIESSKKFLEEISFYTKQRHRHLIISYHNFIETPSRVELAKILKSCYDAGADVVKIACAVNSKKDAARLLSLYEEEGRKIILGMGESGKITRLAALELGAEFSFAALSGENVTAPGQLTFSELASLEKKLHNR